MTLTAASHTNWPLMARIELAAENKMIDVTGVPYLR